MAWQKNCDHRFTHAGLQKASLIVHGERKSATITARCIACSQNISVEIPWHVEPDDAHCEVDGRRLDVHLRCSFCTILLGRGHIDLPHEYGDKIACGDCILVQERKKGRRERRT